MTKGKATVLPIGTVISATGKKKICHNCGSEATQIASFDIDQATSVEYYCEEHIKLVKVRAVKFHLLVTARKGMTTGLISR